MKHPISILFFLLFTLPVFSQLPDFEWANQCGNPPNSTDTKTTLAFCTDGCFYMAGEFLDTANFGGKTLVSAGGTDIFLVKYSAAGESMWSVRIGASDDEYVQKIIADEEGNVLVSGYFYGTTQIGSDEYTSYGGQDLFIAKYNAGGDYLWSARAGGAMADYLTGLTTDPDQNYFIAGFFYGSMMIGDTTLPLAQGSDIFLAKFNAEGDFLWANAAGGSSSDQVHSASCDPDGNVLIAGSFYYDITLGDTTMTTTDPVGVFIGKYLPDGNLDQVFQLDGTYLNTEAFVTATPSGDFYISGNFSEQVTFGAKVFNAGEFNQDIYVAKYNASCDLLWARHAFSYGSDQVVDIATDEFDNLYITGHYLDSIHFELLTLDYTLCCGSREIFIVNYSSSGTVLWGRQISGTRANIQSIELNQQGNLLLSGLFTEEVIFGKLSLSHYDGFRNYVTCLETGLYTSIIQNEDAHRLTVFPNPAIDRIQISGLEINQPVYYSIFSLGGGLVNNGMIGSGGYIHISYLPAGLYFLRLTSIEDKFLNNCLFIKQ